MSDYSGPSVTEQREEKAKRELSQKEKEFIERQMERIRDFHLQIAKLYKVIDAVENNDVEYLTQQIW